MCCGLRGGLVTIGACFNLGEDYSALAAGTSERHTGCLLHTLQPVDGPLFKLLEGDLSRWRRVVQIQTMRVILLLVGGRGELSLLVIDGCPAFGINPMGVLSNHGVECAISARDVKLESNLK